MGGAEEERTARAGWSKGRTWLETDPMMEVMILTTTTTMMLMVMMTAVIKPDVDDENSDDDDNDDDDEDPPNGVCRMVAEAKTDRWPSVAAPGHPNNRRDDPHPCDHLDHFHYNHYYDS